MSAELTPDSAAGTLRPGDVAVIQGIAYRVVAVQDDHFWGADPEEPRQTIKMHYDLLADGPTEYLPREHREEISRRLEELEDAAADDPIAKEDQEKTIHEVDGSSNFRAEDDQDAGDEAVRVQDGAEADPED